MYCVGDCECARFHNRFHRNKINRRVSSMCQEWILLNEIGVHYRHTGDWFQRSGRVNRVMTKSCIWLSFSFCWWKMSTSFFLLPDKQNKEYIKVNSVPCYWNWTRRKLADFLWMWTNRDDTLSGRTSHNTLVFAFYFSFFFLHGIHALQLQIFHTINIVNLYCRKIYVDVEKLFINHT